MSMSAGQGAGGRGCVWTGGRRCVWAGGRGCVLPVVRGTPSCTGTSYPHPIKHAGSGNGDSRGLKSSTVG